MTGENILSTAYYRNMARTYEDRCEWSLAAWYWQKAIDAYPVSASPAGLIEKMAEARDYCYRMSDET